ncbi:MAG: FAD-dependent oxidoreductase [Candidatus Desulfofervidus auxilii]|nr:FAD-dependent oxidoreductase [Candidatus Desulfofervidus auxilii]
MSIAVIGGGIAGLSCAYFLKKQGLDVVVYERKKEVGGRFSTLKIDGVYINRAALMFSKKLNPCFTSLIHELGVPYREMEKSKFVVQIGDKIIRLNKEGLLESGLFSLEEIKLWGELQQLVQTLNFDYTAPDERLLKWHDMSLYDFCKKMKFTDKMINYLAQLYASFQYVEPHELAADKGLFSIAYSITPTFTPIKGMGEVAMQLKKRLGDSVQVNTHITEVRYEQGKGFMVKVKRKEKKVAEFEGYYEYCVFATGQRTVKNIMPEIDFKVPAAKTVGYIIEAVCPQYRSYELIIFPKVDNKHGIHGGEMQHLPDGRSICAVLLYRRDADLSAVFKEYKIIERLGWSPAIGVMPPGGKIVDVVTNVKNAFVIGDFYRFPNLESCVYTAKKVANIIAKEKAS